MTVPPAPPLPPGPRPGGTAHRDLRRLLGCFALGSVAIGLPWPLLLVLVWDRYGGGTGADWAVGLTGAARMAPYVLLSWAAGTLGDRYRRDRLVRVSSALRAACLGAAATAVALGRVEVAVVAAGLAVVATTPAYPAVAAAVPTLAESAGVDRQRALATLVTVEVTAWVVGPALGGLLLAPATRPWTPALAAALAAAGWLLSWGVRLPGAVGGEPDGPAVPAGIGELLHHVVASRAAVRALGRAALLNLVESATGLALLPLVREDWRGSDAAFGLATACLGFGALGAPLLARLAIGRVDVGRSAGGRAGLVAMGVALAVVATTPLPTLALPVLAGLGAVGVLIESRVTAALQDAVAERHRSGVLGIADTVMVTAYLVGGLAAPPLTAAVGARPGLLVVAVVAVGGAVRLRGRAADRGVLYDASGGCRFVDAGDFGDAGDAARPDPRGAPAVGGARLG